MTEPGRTCPVPNCHARLGTTPRGDPWLLCRKHWQRVDVGMQYRVWRAYRAWQRIERQFLKKKAEGNDPGALFAARAEAIKVYIGIRDDAVRQAQLGEPQQLELAQ